MDSEAPISQALKIRIPAWCDQYKLKVNGKAFSAEPQKGYVTIEPDGRNRVEVMLNMDMTVKVVAADPRVKANMGKRAIQRGPLVYCMEEVDNRDLYVSAQLNSQTKFTSKFQPSLLGGVVEVTARATQGTLRFIPYYAWDNREAGKMKVWVDYKE